MIKVLKRLVSHLPLRCQQELKRIYFGIKIGKKSFKTNEKEFARLNEWVHVGDWVMDIGASIGHYSARLSEIVGTSGRVFAFEPVPETFELLSANMARYPYRNITLLNIAASETTGIIGINIPMWDTGLKNYYEAHVTNEETELSVVCMPVDSLSVPNPITLIKIDVEGHELSVLKGMQNLLKRDHPVLIVEGRSAEVAQYLESFGYKFEEAADSANRVFQRKP